MRSDRMDPRWCQRFVTTVLPGKERRRSAPLVGSWGLYRGTWSTTAGEWEVLTLRSTGSSWTGGPAACNNRNKLWCNTDIPSNYHWQSQRLIKHRSLWLNQQCYCNVPSLSLTQHHPIHDDRVLHCTVTTHVNLFPTYCTRSYIKITEVQLKCDGTRWRKGEEVKGKLANGVGSQYPSHYIGTWCIQH